MNAIHKKAGYLAGVLLPSLILATDSFAARYSSTGLPDDSLKTNFYDLLRSGMGSFFIIFCAFGGIVTLFLTRGEGSQKSVPIFGVVMLLAAVGLFGLRIVVSAGMVGNEYLDFDR